MKKDIKPVRHDVSIQRYIDFTLPEYMAIPDVGLLLDQTARLVNGYLETLGDNRLTGSMISNYVKHGIIARPVKKLYYREQIASLIFIAVSKTVLSLEDITRLLEIQRAEYTPEAAYDMFCRHFEAALSDRFKNACVQAGKFPASAENAAGETESAAGETAPHNTASGVSSDAAYSAHLSNEAHGSFNTYLLDSLINAIVECIHLRALIEQADSKYK